MTADANGAAVEVVDATVVEPSQALIPSGPPALAVTPTVQATELVERLNVIKQAMEMAMVESVDYGRIPGVDKPSLWKPGAEKLAVLFQFDVQTTHDERWGPGDHLTVVAHTTVFHILTGVRVGSGEGLCTTREGKYGKRKQERSCPTCGANAVIKGKAEFGGGWLCWKKRDGCGAKFSDGDQAIESQAVGEIENPDLPDSWNTVIKMARKRALVDAILLTTGASALFTQDAEDLPRSEPSPPTATEQAPAPDPLPEDTAKKVLAAIKDAKTPTDWLRMQLVALGVDNVPDGQIMRSTILALSPDQAEQLIGICDEVIAARKKTEAAK